MWCLRNTALLIGALLAVTGAARAQDALIVRVATNLPEADVYADSTRLGPASRGVFRVSPRARRLRLVPPGGTAWSITPVTAPLAAGAGDTVDVRLDFPYYYQVETVPFGATVTLEDFDDRAVLGTTPVLFKSPEVPVGSFVVERRGYKTETLTPGREVWNRYVLTLEPLRYDDVQSAEEAWRPPPRRRRWIDVSAAALAVAAGAVTVHYKFKADRLNDRYQRTGDPGLRPRIKELDTRAAVALGAMQVGLGVLAVRFIIK